MPRLMARRPSQSPGAIVISASQPSVEQKPLVPEGSSKVKVTKPCLGITRQKRHPGGKKHLSSYLRAKVGR